MSYGIEQWGIGTWGGSDFVAIEHVPSDTATNVDRLPFISFILFSQSGDVTIASINVTVNGIALITNGIFTTFATGAIDDTIPTAVQVSAQTLHEFSPLELITVVVTAINASNQALAFGNIWQFSVDDTIHTLQVYIMRNFERVFRTEAAGPLTPPQNPKTEINLVPPANFSGVVL